MDEKNFMIKMYHYINGELKLFVNTFEKLEDAIEHGAKSLCHHFKIFDKDGCVCHDSHGGDHDSYA